MSLIVCIMRKCTWPRPAMLPIFVSRSAKRFISKYRHEAFARASRHWWPMSICHQEVLVELHSCSRFGSASTKAITARLLLQDHMGTGWPHKGYGLHPWWVPRPTSGVNRYPKNSGPEKNDSVIGRSVPKNLDTIRSDCLLRYFLFEKCKFLPGRMKAI